MAFEHEEMEITHVIKYQVTVKWSCRSIFIVIGSKGLIYIDEWIKYDFQPKLPVKNKNIG